MGHTEYDTYFESDGDSDEVFPMRSFPAKRPALQDNITQHIIYYLLFFYLFYVIPWDVRQIH